MTTLLRRKRNERGAIAILFATGAVFLFVLAALVIDLGLARDTKRDSQNAADASSLAAAIALYPDSGTCTLQNPGGTLTSPCYADAAQAAKDYATNNFNVSAAAWSSCTDAAHFYVPTSYSQCISFTDGSNTVSQPAQPTKVRVRIPDRTQKTTLGVLAGVSNVTIGTSARAALSPGGGGPCGLCVIGSTNHDLQNGDAVVTNASVYFNGSLSLNPQGSVTSQGGTVTVQGSGPNKGTVTPTPSTGSGAAVPDPMAALTLPPDMGLLSYKGSNVCTGGPGIYLNPTGSNCTLTQGMYVFIGGTLGGNTGIVANNVTMYFTCKAPTTNTPRACTAGESGANLDLSGNGNFTIKAPTTSVMNSIPKVSIVFDRNNTQTVRLVGNGTLSVTGSIYMKSGTLDMRGNGCTSSTSIDSLIIVDDLAFSGNNACLNVDYTQNNNYTVPPGSPALDQ